MKNLFASSAFILPFTLPLAPFAAKVVEITSIANEGFLIFGATGKIMIDAIFTEGLVMFPTPTEAVLSAFRDIATPFDFIDILFSHADNIDADPHGRGYLNTLNTVSMDTLHD